MKKILGLVLAMVLGICSLCMANNFTAEDFQKETLPDQWVKIQTTLNVIEYLDKDDISYDKDKDLASSRVLFNVPQRKMYVIGRMHADFHNKSVWFDPEVKAYNYGGTSSAVGNITNIQHMSVDKSQYRAARYNMIKKYASFKK